MPAEPVTTVDGDDVVVRYADPGHLADAWGRVRDGHTGTCWRDTLDPHLTEPSLRVRS